MTSRLHSFVATNPCHVYDLALALFQVGSLGTYYSGYPGWRLRPPDGFPLRTCSGRTLVTYLMQRLPERVRIRDDLMFRWQDRGFDAGVAHMLQEDGFLHGIPGQCERSFERARELGLQTVLNHAMGPLQQQRRLVATEYARLGKRLEEAQPLPQAYLDRLEREMKLAQWHCVASTVVRDQLIQDGVESTRIWVVPYGADEQVFAKRRQTPDGPFRLCFAGRQSLRKGIHYLLQAMERISGADWELHCFGMPYEETQEDFRSYRGKARVIQRGSLSQGRFAEALREMHLLVLPSVEEAFGLVIVQALQCGVPCVVSDRVGAKDLLREGKTGSIVAFGDVEGFARAFSNWEQNRITVEDRFPWSKSAEALLEAAAS